MTARRYPPDVAAALGGLLADRLWNPRQPDRVIDWRPADVADVLAVLLDPADAEELARAVLDVFPIPPNEPKAHLAALIADLPAAPAPGGPPPVVRAVEAPLEPPPFGVRPIADVGALAAWQNVPVAELDWFAARARRRQRLPAQLRHYRVLRLPKPDGGVRLIESPKERLATMQRRILDEILAPVPPHPAAHGFVRGRSVRSFAAPHAGRPVVLRLDLLHCFEHVTYPRVRAVFRALRYAPAVADYLAALCTTTLAPDEPGPAEPRHAALLRRRHVPQGAPTSPALVNLVLRGVDFRLAGYAAKHALAYTRYGDDLVLSGEGMDAAAARWVAGRIVADEGFAVHPDKARVMGSHQQQRLAGLVVNESPRATRREYDALKALLHNAVRHGAATQNRDGRADFRGYVYGRIGWVATGSASRRARLLALADAVDWSS